MPFGLAGTLVLEPAVGTDQLDQVVAVHLGPDGFGHLDHHQSDPAFLELAVQVYQSDPGGVVDVVDRATVEAKTT